MSVMGWFIRLPRYGRPLAALNRNGIDIHRRPRFRGALQNVVSLAALIQTMLEAAGVLESPTRSPRLPLLYRPAPPPTAVNYPHVPRGSPAMLDE